MVHSTHRGVAGPGRSDQYPIDWTRLQQQSAGLISIALNTVIRGISRGVRLWAAGRNRSCHRCEILQFVSKRCAEPTTAEAFNLHLSRDVGLNFNWTSSCFKLTKLYAFTLTAKPEQPLCCSGLEEILKAKNWNITHQYFLAGSKGKEKVSVIWQWCDTEQVFLMNR